MNICKIYNAIIMQILTWHRQGNRQDWWWHSWRGWARPWDTSLLSSAEADKITLPHILCKTTKPDEGELLMRLRFEGGGTTERSRLCGFSKEALPRDTRNSGISIGRSRRRRADVAARRAWFSRFGTHHPWHLTTGNQQSLAALLRHSSATVSATLILMRQSQPSVVMRERERERSPSATRLKSPTRNIHCYNFYNVCI